MATHEEHDSAMSSLIVQVIFCVWLPVLGRSSTWPIKKKTCGGRMRNQATNPELQAGRADIAVVQCDIVLQGKEIHCRNEKVF